MTTIKRLERLKSEFTHTKKELCRDDIIDDLRRRIHSIMDRRPAIVGKHSLFHGNPVSLKTLTGGEEAENDAGKFFVTHNRIHGSYRHGFRRLQEISNIDMKTVSLLANHQDLNHFDYTDALFLDTETTGLSGGTGTLPFLIGMGWFEGESFVVRQIFVRDFAEERASLIFFLERVHRKRFLVTFNGKAFDAGLLSSRLILNRLHDPPLASIPHLDLLYPARRLLGHRTINSRLGTLEEAILGIIREGDLFGSEIPQRYFVWLKSRDARHMDDVFLHNRLDLLSMVSLTIHLAEILKGHQDDDSVEQCDLIAASRLLADRGNMPEAAAILETLICSDDTTISHQSRQLLSLIYKREGNLDKAIHVWEMMHMDDPCDIFATVELAKWYEHRARNYKKAFLMVNRVLDESRDMTCKERKALTHRRNRLLVRSSA
jgi:hypothetical protein